jgi:hypothetical protein
MIGRPTVVNIRDGGDYDVFIGRPGPWGNPYTHLTGTRAQHVVGTVEEAIELYRLWLRARLCAGEPGLVEALAALQGQRLGCFCAPGPCHGDVLASACIGAVLMLGDIPSAPSYNDISEEAERESREKGYSFA